MEYEILNDYGDKYYTKNKTLYDFIKKYSKADILEERFRAWGVGIFGLCIIPIILLGLVSDLVVGISFGIWVVTLIIYCYIGSQVVQNQCVRKDEYIRIFKDSDEYKEQYEAYCKRNEEARQKHFEQKSKDLVEAYDILDDKKMSKEKKIKLLKSYIQKGEE